MGIIDKLVCPECGEHRFTIDFSEIQYGTVTKVFNKTESSYYPFEEEISDSQYYSSEDYQEHGEHICQNCGLKIDDWEKELIPFSEWETKEKLKILDEAIKE